MADRHDTYSVFADLDERDQRVLDVLELKRVVDSVELESASLMPFTEVEEAIKHLQAKGLVEVRERERGGGEVAAVVHLNREALREALG
jgi:hypothetical protein